MRSGTDVRSMSEITGDFARQDVPDNMSDGSAYYRRVGYYDDDEDGGGEEVDEVAEVAVIGLPDELWIEAVTAVIVLKEGAELTAETVRTHVKERLSGFKVPKRVDFVAELPRNQSGKLLKRALRAERTQEAR